LPPSVQNNSAASRPEPVDPQRLEQRFAQRLEALRAALSNADPARVAQLSGAQQTLDRQLALAFWGRSIRISSPEWVAYPEGSDQPLSSFDQALLLYYLTTADGEPLNQEWISFSDLPDGRFYNQAFQGYTGKELALAFREDRAAFEEAAQVLGGARYPLGDAAYAFQVLPRVPLLVVYWQGDEDFPSSCQILFDAAASHYLPTDAYAILGSTLTRRLIKARS
jgi:hypothetical protein